jgi:hypothetical protein
MKKTLFYTKREVCGTVMPIYACDNSVQVCANSERFVVVMPICACDNSVQVCANSERFVVVMPICARDNSVKVCANRATPQFKLCNKIVLTDPITTC